MSRTSRTAPQVDRWTKMMVAALLIVTACSQGNTLVSGTGGGRAEGTGGSETKVPSIVLGDPVTLLSDGSLGLHYFPDEGTSQLATTESTMLVVSASTS